MMSSRQCAGHTIGDSGTIALGTPYNEIIQTTTLTVDTLLLHRLFHISFNNI